MQDFGGGGGGEPDGKRLIGRPMRRWEYILKMNFQDVG